jgi:hypothetical protein
MSPGEWFKQALYLLAKEFGIGPRRDSKKDSNKNEGGARVRTRTKYKDTKERGYQRSSH